MSALLITGATGYLGGRLALELERTRPCAAIRLGVDPSAGLPDWARRHPIAPIDFDAPTALATACDGVETVIHLAALNEIDCAADPERALAVNTLGTLRMLRAAESAGVRRFVLASTAHVYGAPLAGRIDERSPTRPVHPYAISKRSAEDCVLAAGAAGRMEAVVIRLSNALGAPRDGLINRWTLIGNDLCRQAAVDGELHLRSSGAQRRDFIALADACRTILHLAGLPAGRLGDGVFNVGGARCLSVLQFAELVAGRCESRLGYRPAIARPPARPGETAPELDYRIDKLLATGFALRNEIEDEIDATLRFCRAAFVAPAAAGA